jgi:hypothetical protein
LFVSAVRQKRNHHKRRHHIDPILGRMNLAVHVTRAAARAVKEGAPMQTLSLRALLVFRMFGGCAAIVSSGGLVTAAPEMYLYIVVLHDRAPADGSVERGEPHIPGLGGEVLHRWQNRRVVRMSELAVRALVGQRGVKYVQRVQTEGAVSRRFTAGNLRCHGRCGVGLDPPAWSSGEYK